MPNESLGAILLPLADNGGGTKTHALAMGSPALDASPDDATCPATDQRGNPRPRGPACDIGSFEGVAVSCNGLVTTMVGTINDDRLTGTAGRDVVSGLLGNDTIFGLGGGTMSSAQALALTLRTAGRAATCSWVSLGMTDCSVKAATTGSTVGSVRTNAMAGRGQVIRPLPVRTSRAYREVCDGLIVADHYSGLRLLGEVFAALRAC